MLCVKFRDHYYMQILITMPVKTLHKKEAKLSLEVVKQLLKDQFPDYSHLAIQPLKHQGTDNVMLKLGEDKIIRFPRTQRSEENLKKEYLWLPKIESGLSIQIPHIIEVGQPCEQCSFQWAIVNYLGGSSPSDNNPLDLAQAAKDLGHFIKELQRVDTNNAPLCSRESPSMRSDKETRQLIPALSDVFDVKEITQLWEAALKIPTWEKAPVWLHGDIHAGNLLVQNKKITGVIDFGMSGVGDPACDLMIGWMLFKEDARETFRNVFNPDKSMWDRARGCALHFGIMAYSYYKNRDPFLAGLAKKTLEEVITESR